MSFMQREITGQQEWLEIDGASGVEFTPIEYADGAAIQTARDLDNGEDVDDEDIQDFIGSVYSCGKVYSATIRMGFGARLSAPGYLDCTEWGIFDTAAEAEEYLSETYPEDEDE